ncbi:YitT family protein [bacterium]|jgi:uncharacterized membrane-anchored protein YitT (DUF2179 family)|nr:YitT family protein [bacterium]
MKMRRFFSRSLYIISGISLTSLGIKSFLLPNHFIDGGITGISMLLSEVSQINLALMVLLINIPFVIISSKQISWKFAIRSTIAILGLAVMLHFIPFPHLTNDKVLSAIFGGLCVGAGIGFAFRGGAVLDGTEILSILLSKKLGLKVGDIILLSNIVIFAFSGVFLGIDRALYSVLTYLSASKAVDFLVYGFHPLGIHIISKDSQKIKQSITSNLGLGITIFNGETGYSASKQDILFCVCSRFDVPKVKELVAEFDSNAFITIHKITDTLGGRLKPMNSHPNIRA